MPWWEAACPPETYDGNDRVCTGTGDCGSSPDACALLPDGRLACGPATPRNVYDVMGVGSVERAAITSQLRAWDVDARERAARCLVLGLKIMAKCQERRNADFGTAGRGRRRIWRGQQHVGARGFELSPGAMAAGLQAMQQQSTVVAEEEVLVRGAAAVLCHHLRFGRGGVASVTPAAILAAVRSLCS